MTQVPPPAAPMGYQVPPPQKSTGLAIGSLICGIASIAVFCIWWLSIPLGVIAVVLAVMARKAIARGEASGDGMAKAGLICGIVGAALSILVTLLALAGLSMFGDKIKQEMERQQRLQQQQQNSSTTQP